MCSFQQCLKYVTKKKQTQPTSTLWKPAAFQETGKQWSYALPDVPVCAKHNTIIGIKASNNCTGLLLTYTCTLIVSLLDDLLCFLNLQQNLQHFLEWVIQKVITLQNNKNGKCSHQTAGTQYFISAIKLERKFPIQITQKRKFTSGHTLSLLIIYTCSKCLEKTKLGESEFQTNEYKLMLNEWMMVQYKFTKQTGLQIHCHIIVFR